MTLGDTRRDAAACAQSVEQGIARLGFAIGALLCERNLHSAHSSLCAGRQLDDDDDSMCVVTRPTASSAVSPSANNTVMGSANCSTPQTSASHRVRRRERMATTVAKAGSSGNGTRGDEWTSQRHEMTVPSHGWQRTPTTMAQTCRVRCGGRRSRGPQSTREAPRNTLQVQ